MGWLRVMRLSFWFEATTLEIKFLPGMNVRLSSRSKVNRKPINIRLFLIYRQGLWC